LDSVKGLIDYVLIEDTGSSDGTQEVVRSWLVSNQVLGEVNDVGWRDFAFNRTHALASLRKIQTIDFALVMDADDVLAWDRTAGKEALREVLDSDMVDVEIQHGLFRYWRPLILRNSIPFYFVGVLHEYVVPPAGAISRKAVEGFHVRYSGEGARSRNPNKFLEDAKTLEAALAADVEPDLRARYTFYLAKSLQESGQIQEARDMYLRRSSMGFWVEEVYWSLYQAGKLTEHLGFSLEEAIELYVRASGVRPQRSESLHAASELCRKNSRFDDGYWFAKRGLPGDPGRGLFVASWIYDYGLMDELSVNAYWSGRRDEFVQVTRALLEKPSLPQDVRLRIQENLRFGEVKG
jgi:tetratricopeptide (TPR) repeat protein